MKRLIAGLLLGLLAGAAVGFAAGIFVYPFWFLNEAATETLAGGVERATLAEGAFVDVSPSDPVHHGQGGVTLYREASGRRLVHLREDFEVGPGPRYHVYLVDSAAVDGKAAFEASEKLDLGRLRAFHGSQIYDIPVSADLTKARSVVIWCKEFGVLIAPASLAYAAGQS